MKRSERAALRLLDAAKQIERGGTVVQIYLPWGEAEWRASMYAIHGKAKDGSPFTVTNVHTRPLVRWLKGEAITTAFPEMDPSDRALLSTGDCRHVAPPPPQVLKLAHACHPGEVVLEYLDSFGWTQRELAIRTGLPLKYITEICEGKESITHPIAVLLEKTLRRPARLWLNLQQQYDEAKK